jgi:apolipoprotein N-acyltransferase
MMTVTLSGAVILLAGPLVGVIGGLITWVRPRLLFGLLGWIFGLIAPTMATWWVNRNLPQGVIDVWMVPYTPVAFASGAIACGLVFVLGLLMSK